MQHNITHETETWVWDGLVQKTIKAEASILVNMLPGSSWYEDRIVQYIPYSRFLQEDPMILKALHSDSLSEGT